MHPYLNNKELLDWCNEKNIHVTAYAPLGNVNPEFASALEDPVIAKIAVRLSKTPAQVRCHCYRQVSMHPLNSQPRAGVESPNGGSASHSCYNQSFTSTSKLAVIQLHAMLYIWVQVYCTRFPFGMWVA